MSALRRAPRPARAPAAFAAALLLAACGADEPLPAPPPPPGPAVSVAASTVDLDESYVILALGSAWVKHHTVIHSGNVGADQGAFSGPFAHGAADVVIGRHVRATGGTKVVGNRVLLKRHAEVSEAHTKDGLTVKANASVGEAVQLTDAHFPVFPVKPTAPPCEPPGDVDLLVKKHAVRVLEPGHYGDLVVKKGAHVHFVAGDYVFGRVRVHGSARLDLGEGTYHMQDLRAGRSVEVRFGGPTDLIIAERFLLGRKSRFNPTDTSGISPPVASRAQARRSPTASSTGGVGRAMAPVARAGSPQQTTAPSLSPAQTLAPPAAIRVGSRHAPSAQPKGQATSRPSVRQRRHGAGAAAAQEADASSTVAVSAPAVAGGAGGNSRQPPATDAHAATNRARRAGAEGHGIAQPW